MCEAPLQRVATLADLQHAYHAFLTVARHEGSLLVTEEREATRVAIDISLVTPRPFEKSDTQYHGVTRIRIPGRCERCEPALQFAAASDRSVAPVEVPRQSNE